MNNPTQPDSWLDSELTLFGQIMQRVSPEDADRIRNAYQTTKQKILQHEAQAVELAHKVTGETSDGYHTFNELYEFRKLYNALLFNEWAKVDSLGTDTFYNVHKSYRHSDGELCFGGGWFVVSAQLPSGQVTNHYEAKDWDLFQVPERDRADEWDGHIPQDVVKRLEAALRAGKESNQGE